MEENMQYPMPPEPAKRPAFPMGRRELVFAAGAILFSLLLCNSLFFCGVNLGVGVAALGLMGCTFFYLLRSGRRPDRYTAVLLILCALIAASFLRSDDGGMKFVSVCLLMTVPGLTFCQMAGQNLRRPEGITSLLDSPRSLFMLGMGKMPEATRGIRQVCSDSGTIGKTGGAVILGAVIAAPVVAVLIPLLMSADAAFEGLLDLLPETDWVEIFFTAFTGIPVAWILYTRGVALGQLPQVQPLTKRRRGLNAITVNTVLIAVAAVYLAYLASQTAYFVGGFAGILPAEYTLAEYARRGFFEMGWLCAINLGIIALAMGLATARGKASGLTKIICLFLGLVTLFLVVSASAKMVLYIGSYGLTRMRVLTEAFMVWLAIVTVVVCFWIFRPKTAYMKWALVLGLAFCAALMWADVDTQVARYNVRAYQEGSLETVDVLYLRRLNDSAVPYLVELTEDSDKAVAEEARRALTYAACNVDYDRQLRSWNYSTARARELLEPWMPAEEAGTAQP